ncbi:MAG: hypothetical protein PF447_11515 [Spirochaetaceae bacterium]|nr:hypothetical protein [Spirochaetaceae bacterium]
MNKINFIIIAFFFSFTLHSMEEEVGLHIQIDSGIAGYVGDFKNHLDISGAYTVSPVLDASLLIYPTEHWGIGVSWGSMTVIHRRSTPIEGVIRYNTLINEFTWHEDKRWLSLYGAIGFQDPGMSLQWYGSAVADLGLRLGWEIKPKLSFTIMTGYRFSFLRSIIIAQKYEDIDYPDNLSSMRLQAGLRYQL